MSNAGSGRAPLQLSSGAESDSLMRVARKVAATIGTDFFQATARHLATALTANCVLIGEFVGGHVERCRSVAAWMDGAPAELEFALAESAVAQVVLGKPCLWRSDVQTRFPSDTLLKEIGAQACAGVPLMDEAHEPLGILMALYRRPAQSLRTTKSMLEIFAERASAELRRKREDDALRKSEQRYRAFVARNDDAMWRIEFDPPVPRTSRKRSNSSASTKPAIWRSATMPLPDCSGWKKRSRWWDPRCRVSRRHRIQPPTRLR